MIYVFTGKTGSGKTKLMVDLAYKEWKRGRDIYSNTILFYERYGGKKRSVQKTWHGKPVRRGNITYFKHLDEILEVNNAIILFDEGQVLMNARQWETLPGEFQYKLQQHRKHNLDLYLTTQNIRFVDLTIRALFQKWIHATRVWGIGERPCWIGMFRYELKDLDELPINNADDTLVPVIAKVNKFISHLWSRRLYDTYFDVGFDRLKTIWAKVMISPGKWQTKGYIIQKNLSLSDVQKSISTLRSASGIPKFQNSKKG